MVAEDWVFTRVRQESCTHVFNLIIFEANYRGAFGALLVYDISRRATFENVSRWLDELNSHSDTTVARMLVGNKCALENIREVSLEEGKSLAEAKGLFSLRHLHWIRPTLELPLRSLSEKSIAM